MHTPPHCMKSARVAQGRAVPSLQRLRLWWDFREHHGCRSLMGTPCGANPAAASAVAPVFTFSSDGRENRALGHLRKRVVPSLSASRHKGEAGRIAVLGGSLNFTGAPYFASAAALRTGADLAHIFCSDSASTPIKAYSPELIVLPLLSEGDDGAKSAIDPSRIESWLKRMHCLVVGPGLSRNEAMLSSAKAAVEAARRLGVPVVMDADALALVQADPSLAKGHSACVLTPNAVELQRLQAATGVAASQAEAKALRDLSECLGGATIVRKGREDMIHGGTPGKGVLLRCGMFGSPRRCGGQGDVLCGALATFLAWAVSPNAQPDSGERFEPGPHAAFGGCVVVRRAAQLAFAKFRRATGTSVILDEVGVAMDELFPLDPYSHPSP